MDQINYLPDHILVEIFGNLSPRMVKCCALVCKRWGEIIGSSMELMGKFTLILDRREQEAKEIQRKHQTAKGVNIEDSLNAISRFHSLQSLEIGNYIKRTTKLSFLIDVVNSLTLLKIFKAYYYGFIDDLSTTSDCLKKVKNNLIELSCDLKLIRIFDCCTVEKLELTWENTADEMKMLFVEFLKKQRNLKVFKLYDEYGGDFFILPGIFELKFSLNKFDYYCREEPFPHYESFIKFLDQHNNSLTSLELRFCTEPQFGIDFIHKFALENIVNLKHIELGYFKHVDDRYLRGHELTYNELPAATNITRNLEHLTVRARSTDMNENRRFYDMFPNLKRLDFYLSSEQNSDLLHCINQRCVNVESLYIYHLSSRSTVYFSKLKELTVNIYSEEEHLCDFIRRHSQTLEKIVIEEWDIGVHWALKEMLNCPNLNYLKITCISTEDHVLRKLNKFSMKAEPFTLDVPLSNSPFKFPDEKAVWDEEVKIYQVKHHQLCDF